MTRTRTTTLSPCNVTAILSPPSAPSYTPPQRMEESCRPAVRQPDNTRILTTLLDLAMSWHDFDGHSGPTPPPTTFRASVTPRNSLFLNILPRSYFVSRNLPLESFYIPENEEFTR